MNMIDIITIKGERYSINKDTGRIFRDGVLVPSSEAQLVYSHLGDRDIPPKISGIWLKDSNSILTLTGKIYQLVTNVNSVY